ncbi:MAG: flippase-like domain-containing protein [Gemmataceae bacterium]|nr:flippase-like domain-containing protein [Gemmataceae bacterium]
MNPTAKRWLVRAIKLTLALVVLFFIGRIFWDDLKKLEYSQIQLQPGWLVLSGGIYILALMPSVWFFRHVHQLFGYPVAVYACARAHMIGHLGKYAPGKMLALVMRSALLKPSGIPYGVSLIVSFYEVLTAMASGALVAAIVFVFDPPTIPEGLQAYIPADWHPAWFGVGLLAVCGLPLLPGVFNFIIAKMTAKLSTMEMYRLPPIRYPTLLLGIVVTSFSWWLQGLSAWILVYSVVPGMEGLSFETVAQYTAAIAFTNVVGFVVILPAGFGVRELLLKHMFAAAGPVPLVAVAVILLRFNSIAAEIIIALVLYWIKPAGKID